MKSIAILLFEGVEELDAVGPREVLAAWTQAHPEGRLGGADAVIGVRPDDRFVDDGDVTTSSGPSAGIGLTRYLVGRSISGKGR